MRNRRKMPLFCHFSKFGLVYKPFERLKLDFSISIIEHNDFTEQKKCIIYCIICSKAIFLVIIEENGGICHFWHF